MALQSNETTLVLRITGGNPGWLCRRSNIEHRRQTKANNEEINKKAGQNGGF